MRYVIVLVALLGLAVVSAGGQPAPAVSEVPTPTPPTAPTPPTPPSAVPASPVEPAAVATPAQQPIPSPPPAAQIAPTPPALPDHSTPLPVGFPGPGGEQPVAPASGLSAPQAGDWLATELGDRAARLIEDYPVIVTVLAAGKLFSRPLLFVAVFLLVGLTFSGLAARAIVPGGSQGNRATTELEAAHRRAARWAILAWAAGLIIACEVVGLTWFQPVLTALVELIGGLGRVVASMFGALVWLVVGSIAIYELAPQGRDIVLSLLGWYYIRRHPGRPGPDQQVDVGGGLTGTVLEVEPLHTTFDLGGGRRKVMPNWWLMRTHFHWDRPRNMHAVAPDADAAAPGQTTAGQTGT